MFSICIFIFYFFMLVIIDISILFLKGINLIIELWRVGIYIEIRYYCNNNVEDLYDVLRNFLYGNVYIFF